MKRNILCIALLFGACATPPKPTELVGLEQLRAGPDGKAAEMSKLHNMGICGVRCLMPKWRATASHSTTFCRKLRVGVKPLCHCEVLAICGRLQACKCIREIALLSQLASESGRVHDGSRRTSILSSSFLPLGGYAKKLS